ncbi:hypothetical protein JCGZ_19764 [Jatropha curcas]|uniref:Uncharacterized protein n=1 Tax=Jatropha curcas TaxID=180498 RepID=A0A067L881_JATCU|nr:hypothetical protein JCGZ_19764 [Jatropha curcas]
MTVLVEGTETTMDSSVERTVAVDPAKQAIISSKRHLIQLLRVMSSILVFVMQKFSTAWDFSSTVHGGGNGGPASLRRGP